MEIACTQTITLLYIYLYVWGLNPRLNNINLYQSLSFIIYIDLNHHCHHYWTSELLLNFWECTQGSDITNKWVVHFVILPSLVYFLCPNHTVVLISYLHTLSNGDSFINFLVYSVYLFSFYPSFHTLYKVSFQSFRLLFLFNPLNFLTHTIR